jgi:hypothetical protein
VTEPYQPTLHRFPDDTAGRFAVIREFLRRWHGLDTGTVGRTVDRVDEAEARAGKPLPLAVREWIVLLDDLSRIGGWGRVLRDSWGLKKVPDCPAFSLLCAGEDDGHWGPMLRDLGDEDPPTHEFILDYERDRFKRARQVAPRVSTWAIEFIVSYLRLGGLQVDRDASKPAVDRLRTQTADPVVASRIGRSELLEFAGGLIHAEPDGNSYHLRCYVPYAGGAPGDCHRAAGELERRVEAMLGVTRI